MAVVARDLGMSVESLRQLIQRAEVEEGKREGLTEAERDELRRLLNVTNTGSLAGWLSSVQASEITSSSLKEQLNVEVLAPDPNDPATYEMVANAPLDSFLAGPVSLAFSDGSKIPIAANGGAVDLEFKVTLNQSAGNAYQGETEVVTFTVNAVQMKNNP